MSTTQERAERTLDLLRAPSVLQRLFLNVIAEIDEKDKTIADLQEKMVGMVPKPNATGGHFFGYTSSKYATQVIHRAGEDGGTAILEAIAELAWNAGHEKGKGMAAGQPTAIQVEMGPFEVLCFTLASLHAVERMVTVEGKVLGKGGPVKMLETFSVAQRLVHNPKVMAPLPVMPMVEPEAPNVSVREFGFILGRVESLRKAANLNPALTPAAVLREIENIVKTRCTDEDITRSELADILRGIKALRGAAKIGDDVTRAGVLFQAVSLLGLQAMGDALTRSGFVKPPAAEETPEHQAFLKICRELSLCLGTADDQADKIIQWVRSCP